MPVAAGQPGVGGVARPCEPAQGATLSPHHLPLAGLRVGVRTPVEVGTPRPTRERPHRVSFPKWHQGRPHPCPPTSPSAASSIGLGPQTPCRKQESSGQPSRSPGSALEGRGCSWLYWKWRGRGEGRACLRANPRAPGLPRSLAGCPSPRQAAVHLQVPDPSCSCGQWPVWQGLGTGLLGRDPHPAGALTGSGHHSFLPAVETAPLGVEYGSPGDRSPGLGLGLLAAPAVEAGSQPGGSGPFCSEIALPPTRILHAGSLLSAPGSQTQSTPVSPEPCTWDAAQPVASCLKE